MGWGMIPVIRVLLGLDEKLTGSYIWSISFLVGGLMCGLTAMLLMVRKQPTITQFSSNANEPKTAAKIHASGLLILSGIPLANFLGCYYLWVKNRKKSEYLDRHGREAICFQISIYLYLLMCLFMAYIIVGAVAIPLVIVLHVIATLVAINCALSNKTFRYPANINIIDRLFTESELKSGINS